MYICTDNMRSCDMRKHSDRLRVTQLEIHSFMTVITEVCCCCCCSRSSGLLTVIDVTVRIM